MVFNDWDLSKLEERYDKAFGYCDTTEKYTQKETDPEQNTAMSLKTKSIIILKKYLSGLKTFQESLVS